MVGPVPKSVVVGSSREPLDDTFISIGAACASVITRLVVKHDQDARPRPPRAA